MECGTFCGGWIAPCDGDDAGMGDGAREWCDGVGAIAGGAGEGTWPDEERGKVEYNGCEPWGGGSMILAIAGDALAR